MECIAHKKHAFLFILLDIKNDIMFKVLNFYLRQQT